MNREEKILKALDLMINHIIDMCSMYLEREEFEDMYDIYNERRTALESFRRIITNDALLDDYIGE